MKRILSRIVFLMILIFAVNLILTAADANFSGTWKLNLAKSRFPGNGLPPKSQTMKMEPSKGGFTFTIDVVTASGRIEHIIGEAKLEGKDYPVTGDPNADTAAFKRKDVRTLEQISKRGGSVTRLITITISPDSKTLTAVVPLAETNS